MKEENGILSVVANSHSILFDLNGNLDDPPSRYEESESAFTDQPLDGFNNSYLQHGSSQFSYFPTLSTSFLQTPEKHRKTTFTDCKPMLENMLPATDLPPSADPIFHPNQAYHPPPMSSSYLSTYSSAPYSPLTRSQPYLKSCISSSANGRFYQRSASSYVKIPAPVHNPYAAYDTRPHKPINFKNEESLNMLEQEVQQQFIMANSEERKLIYDSWMGKLKDAASKLLPHQLAAVKNELADDINLPILMGEGEEFTPFSGSELFSAEQDSFGAQRKRRKSEAKRARNQQWKDDVKKAKKEKKEEEEKISPQAEQARLRKARMAFPKGTFLIRLADVTHRDGKDHIWCVDNHQLLLRFNQDSLSPEGLRVYTKTDRYTGWLCDEPWHYYPMTEGKEICSIEGKDQSKVILYFPKEEFLREAITLRYEENQRKQHANEEERAMQLIERELETEERQEEGAEVTEMDDMEVYKEDFSLFP